MSLFPDSAAPESGGWTTQRVDAIDGIRGGNGGWSFVPRRCYV